MVHFTRVKLTFPWLSVQKHDHVIALVIFKIQSFLYNSAVLRDPALAARLDASSRETRPSWHSLASLCGAFPCLDPRRID